MIIGQIVKQAGEAFPLTWDFAAELSGGETIANATLTARNYATGTDTSATFLAAAAEQIDGAKVTKGCRAGAAGETHIVQCRVTTSAGNIYEHEVEVAILES